MKRIVITGGTRGIGHGMAAAFLTRGCAVTICSRHQRSVDEAVDALATRGSPGAAYGVACDVTRFDDVQALWDAAVAQMGGVDIWINNAGISHRTAPIWELETAKMADVIQTNVLGTLHGSKVAMSGMLAQGSGALYNLEGLGSDGRVQPGLAVYGASKRAIRYLTRTLVKEAAGTPVLVGFLSPGMVTTELLIGEEHRRDPERWERAKRVFNILADRVETVAPWLAERVLANDKHGARIAWLTPGKAFWRFLTAPLTKRNVFDD